MLFYLNFTTDGGWQFEPLEKTSSRLDTGVVVGVAVGGIGAHVQARVTVGHAPWTVTHALDTGLDQGELVRVHDGVDGLQRHVGHLHRPRHGAGLGPELVAERLPEANLPGDGGEVCHLASIILHQYLAINRTFNLLQLILRIPLVPID